jgi:hypothetical protein
MANTTFTGPVNSLNGFSGTVLSVASATITNLVATTLTIGSTKLTNGSVSGVVGGSQLGRIPVLIGSTTRYIQLYDSLTP